MNNSKLNSIGKILKMMILSKNILIYQVNKKKKEQFSH